MRLKPYPAYKESGVVWLRSIPKSWKTTKIKFDTYVKGRVGWHGLNSDEFSEVGVHLVTGTDFKYGFVNWNSCYRITEERYLEDPYIQLQEGDLLITKDGTIGKLARVKNLPVRASLNSGIFLIRAKNNAYLEDYLYWILRSTAFDHFMDLHKAGSTIQHLYQEVFNQFSFPIPSHREQLLLVNFLDRETTKLDTLIAKQQHLIELLQEKRQAIISHAVTKGLDPDAKMKDSGIKWLGMVPEHWDVSTISREFQIKAGGDLKTEFFSEECNDIFSYPIYTNSTKEGAVYGFTSKPFFPANTITVTGRGEIGFAVYRENEYDAIIRLLVLTPKNNHYCKYFTYYINSMLRFNEGSTAVNQLSTQQISPHIILCPSYDERIDISNYIDRENNRIDTLIDKAKHSIELAKEHRVALISAAVTGKIDVREAA